MKIIWEVNHYQNFPLWIFILVFSTRGRNVQESTKCDKIDDSIVLNQILVVKTASAIKATISCPFYRVTRTPYSTLKYVQVKLGIELLLYFDMA